MLAFQQQQQQQPRSVATASANAPVPNTVSAVPPASVSAAKSKLRFGNTGLTSWDTSSNANAAKNDHLNAASPAKPYGGAPANAYRLHADAHHASSTPSSSVARSQQGSRGSHRTVNPAFAAPHWQNYHNHYHQHHQQKEGANKTRSARRIPNASDLNKQWRATATAAQTVTTPAISTSSKSAAVRENASLMSSTYQGNDSSTLLSGLSLALNKHKIHNQASGATANVAEMTAGKIVGIPLFDAAQSRTPNPLSPAISMKTPNYVDPESLPFELGSTITDNTTGKHYRLLSVLGEGSYAVVYLARCSHDGAKYALKCLSKLGLTARQLSLQRTELEIHASVCPHPHIVTLYSHFETRDWLFLVMERVAGPDLYDYITQHPSFNSNHDERRFAEATRLFEQMIDAVAHIHALKAYHRDLKPENFILGADGNLKLTDFGLATRESLSTDFECGSKPYMSYENRNGGLNPNDPTVYGPRDDYSPRLSDVWALGVLFLNLLFAQSPWTDPSRESCFKFCRFLREGAGFLIGQFPKLPREVSDFLVTRIFSPESGRCNVMELKQWVQDLGYPFNLAKAGPVAAPRPSTTRHSNKTAAAPAARRTAAHATPAALPSAAIPVAINDNGYTGGKAHHAAGSAGKKWSFTSGGGGMSGSIHKLPNMPQPVHAANNNSNHGANGSFATNPDFATTAPTPATVKAKSPHHNAHKRFAAMQSSENMPVVSPFAQNATSKINHLSTSVPAAVFSQIIPATQAAAARKMMPREFNPTVAKAAAAILQSSMLCLPKNGLGQGKPDDSVDISAMDADNIDEAGASSWNHLEDLSEAAEEEESSEDVHGYSSGAAAGAPISASAASNTKAGAVHKFPKQQQQALSSSLGFNLSKNFNVFDSDEDMDFSEPISFDDTPRHSAMAAAAKSLPAQKSDVGNNTTNSSSSILKRPLPASAMITPTSATTPEAPPAPMSSSTAGNSYSDDFGILGHFSEDSNSGEGRHVRNGRHAGSSTNSSNNASRTSARVRFQDIVPQAVQQQNGLLNAAARPRRSDDSSISNFATNSAESSLTPTLVTPSVEYYSPRLKPLTGPTTLMTPVSAQGLSNGATTAAKTHKMPTVHIHAVDDVDADDEADGNWRARSKHTNGGGVKYNGAKPKATTMRNAHFDGQNEALRRRNDGSRTTTNHFHNDHYTSTGAAAPSMSSKQQYYGKNNTMHSLPAPPKALGGSNHKTRSSYLESEKQQPTFSWADDVEELPIPSLIGRLENVSVDSKNQQPAANTAASNSFGEEDALSDDLSWSVDEDGFHHGDGMFAMEL
ncbi:hypothetical protein GGI07_000887 [Coemansia sp. Benny D115]|nr:hypothetical protein GGI07_000887 [Coemansia sp. Benny D115]